MKYIHSLFIFALAVVPMQAGDIAECAEAAALWSAWAAQKAPFEAAKALLSANQAAMQAAQASVNTAKKAADAAADVVKKMASAATNVVNIRSIGFEAKMTDVKAFSAGQVSIEGTAFGKDFSANISLDPKQLPAAAQKILESVV